MTVSNCHSSDSFEVRFDVGPRGKASSVFHFGCSDAWYCPDIAVKQKLPLQRKLEKADSIAGHA